MNLHHLRYFYDAARLKSVTKAAGLNLVGQPAISKAIQGLEATLRKSLLTHEKNRFQLTDEGEIVFSYCEKIFQATDQLKDALSSEKSLSGDVRLGWQSSMAECDHLTQALKTIGERYPQISLKLKLGRTDLVRSWVLTGLIDFGVVIENLDLTGLETTNLAAGTFYLVKSKTYQGDWHKDGILTVEGKREVGELQKKYLAKNKRSLKLKMEIGSWGVIKKFALEGMGVGFVPDYMIQSELKQKRLVLVDPKDYAISYQMKLIQIKTKYTSKRSRAVINQICEFAPGCKD